MNTHHMHGREPASLWIERHAHLVRKQGSVLDLACGAGRQTQLFAAMGMQVTALDRNAEALAMINAPRVEKIWADIEQDAWPLQGRVFDGVVVTNYLWRALLPHIAECVRPRGGVLLYETFARGNERYGKPSNPDFLLMRDELLQYFGKAQGFDVVGFEDIEQQTPVPSCVQRICAVKLD